MDQGEPDGIVDIVEFDVVSWLISELRLYQDVKMGVVP
jgi:hypothetical protein